VIDVDNSPNEGSCAREGGADMTTEKEGKKIEIAIETQKLNWYVNGAFLLLEVICPTSRRQLVVVRTTPAATMAQSNADIRLAGS
jgi:hypothetical protein